MKGPDMRDDGTAVKRDPPRTGWYILFLCLIAILTVSAFGLGVRGHLALLRSKAQWDATVEERDRLKGQLAELRVKAAEAEVSWANIQSNLLSVSVQFSAKKLELAQAEEARDVAAGAKKKAEDARVQAEGDYVRIKAETDSLNQKVSELQVSTNTLGSAASLLFAKVSVLKEAQRQAESNLIWVETSVFDTKRNLTGLTDKTQKAQTEWVRISKDLADITPKLATAQAALNVAVQGKQVAETELVTIKAGAEKVTQDAEAGQKLLAKVRTELAKEQSTYKTACEQTDETRKDSALYEGKREAAKEAFQKLEGEKNRVQNQIDVVNGQLGSTQKTLGEKKGELANVEADFAAAFKKRDDAMVREVQANVGVAAAQKRLEDLRSQETDQLKVIQTLKSDIKKLQDNLRNLKSDAAETGKAKEQAK
jgi:chromosome segregation ATPase